MHETQRKLLALAQLEDLESLTYREISERIGCDYASQVKHHLEQLVKRGYLTYNSTGQLLVTGNDQDGVSGLVPVPILGEADCGEATRYATDEIRGYLNLSPTLVPTTVAGLFALKARGNSMNNARIHGNKRIVDGDFVLVKKCEINEVLDGDYVVSVIHGMANIKRLRVDSNNRRVVLLPESLQFFPPVIIANEEAESYQIMGKVVDVIEGVDSLAT